MSERSTLTKGQVLGDYPPPRHNVLLLSCMDLRLIDELAVFMERDNLTNRYDHVVCAGASLGVMQTMKPKYAVWKEAFRLHLEVAIELHKPYDIYIVEHRNCGAYGKFIDGFDDSDPEREKEVHTEWAARLNVQLHEWWKEFDPTDGKGDPIPLNVHGFLMGLRGDVELLDLGPAPKPSKPTKAKTSRKK